MGIVKERIKRAIKASRGEPVRLSVHPDIQSFVDRLHENLDAHSHLVLADYLDEIDHPWAKVLRRHVAEGNTGKTWIEASNHLPVDWVHTLSNDSNSAAVRGGYGVIHPLRDGQNHIAKLHLWRSREPENRLYQGDFTQGHDFWAHVTKEEADDLLSRSREQEHQPPPVNMSRPVKFGHADNLPLFERIKANPHEDAPWLILADSLDESGKPHAAELMRTASLGERSTSLNVYNRGIHRYFQDSDLHGKHVGNYMGHIAGIPVDINRYEHGAIVRLNHALSTTPAFGYVSSEHADALLSEFDQPHQLSRGTPVRLSADAQAIHQALLANPMDKGHWGILADALDEAGHTATAEAARALMTHGEPFWKYANVRNNHLVASKGSAGRTTSGGVHFSVGGVPMALYRESSMAVPSHQWTLEFTHPSGFLKEHIGEARIDDDLGRRILHEGVSHQAEFDDGQWHDDCTTLLAHMKQQYPLASPDMTRYDDPHGEHQPHLHRMESPVRFIDPRHNPDLDAFFAEHGQPGAPVPPPRPQPPAIPKRPRSKVQPPVPTPPPLPPVASPYFGKTGPVPTALPLPRQVQYQPGMAAPSLPVAQHAPVVNPQPPRAATPPVAAPAAPAPTAPTAATNPKRAGFIQRIRQRAGSLASTVDRAGMAMGAKLAPHVDRLLSHPSIAPHIEQTKYDFSPLTDTVKKVGSFLSSRTPAGIEAENKRRMVARTAGTHAHPYDMMQHGSLHLPIAKRLSRRERLVNAIRLSRWMPVRMAWEDPSDFETRRIISTGRRSPAWTGVVYVPHKTADGRWIWTRQGGGPTGSSLGRVQRHWPDVEVGGALHRKPVPEDIVGRLNSPKSDLLALHANLVQNPLDRGAWGVFSDAAMEHGKPWLATFAKIMATDPEAINSGKRLISRHGQFKHEGPRFISDHWVDVPDFGVAQGRIADIPFSIFHYPGDGGLHERGFGRIDLEEYPRKRYQHPDTIGRIIGHHELGQGLLHEMDHIEPDYGHAKSQTETDRLKSMYPTPPDSVHLSRGVPIYFEEDADPANLHELNQNRERGCNCGHPNKVLRNGSGHGKGPDGKPCPIHRRWLEENIFGRPRRKKEKVRNSRVDHVSDLPAFHAQIEANPHDLAARNAYMDHLMDNGLEAHAEVMRRGIPMQSPGITPDQFQEHMRRYHDQWWNEAHPQGNHLISVLIPSAHSQVHSLQLFGASPTTPGNVIPLSRLTTSDPHLVNTFRQEMSEHPYSLEAQMEMHRQQHEDSQHAERLAHEWDEQHGQEPQQMSMRSRLVQAIRMAREPVRMGAADDPGLIAHAAAHPWDDAPHLILADSLEEQGSPFGPLLRKYAQHERENSYWDWRDTGPHPLSQHSDYDPNDNELSIHRLGRHGAFHFYAVPSGFGGNLDAPLNVMMGMPPGYFKHGRIHYNFELYPHEVHEIARQIGGEFGGKLEHAARQQWTGGVQWYQDQHDSNNTNKTYDELKNLPEQMQREPEQFARWPQGYVGSGGFRNIRGTVSHAALDSWLGNKPVRRLGDNKVIHRIGDDIGVKLHTTDVVVTHPDGSYSLATGQWNTPTTHRTIGSLTGLLTHSNRGQPTVHGRPLFDGIRLLGGTPVHELVPDPEAAMGMMARAETERRWKVDHSPHPEALTLQTYLDHHLHAHKFSPEDHAFMSSILANPEDHAPWLVYADYLDERGDPRANRIRHAFPQRERFSRREQLKQAIRLHRGLPVRLAAQRDRPLDVNGAAQRVGSANHVALVSALRDTLTRSGLTPHKVWPAIHDVAGAARASAIAEVYGENRPGAADYGAAWQGLIAKQPSMIVFRSHPQGADSVYKMAFKGPQKAMSQLLDRVGVSSRVFVPHGLGTHVYVYDKGRQLRDSVGGLASRLGLQPVEHLGNGNPVGGGDDMGRAQYRGEIRRAEQMGRASDQLSIKLRNARQDELNEWIPPISETAPDLGLPSWDHVSRVGIFSDYLEDIGDPRWPIVRGHYLRHKGELESGCQWPGCIGSSRWQDVYVPEGRHLTDHWGRVGTDSSGGWPRGVALPDGGALHWSIYSRSGRGKYANRPGKVLVSWAHPVLGKEGSRKEYAYFQSLISPSHLWDIAKELGVDDQLLRKQPNEYIRPFNHHYPEETGEHFSLRDRVKQAIRMQREPVRMALSKPEFEAWVRSISQNPQDEANHLIFADRLEEDGDPRHEIVRQHIASGQHIPWEHQNATQQSWRNHLTGGGYDYNRAESWPLRRGGFVDTSKPGYMSFVPHSELPVVRIRWQPAFNLERGGHQLEYISEFPMEKAIEIARHVGAKGEGDYEHGPWATGPILPEQMNRGEPIRLSLLDAIHDAGQIRGGMQGEQARNTLSLGLHVHGLPALSELLLNHPHPPQLPNEPTERSKATLHGDEQLPLSLSIHAHDKGLWRASVHGPTGPIGSYAVDKLTAQRLWNEFRPHAASEGWQHAQSPIVKQYARMDHGDTLARLGLMMPKMDNYDYSNVSVYENHQPVQHLPRVGQDDIKTNRNIDIRPQQRPPEEPPHHWLLSRREQMKRAIRMARQPVKMSMEDILGIHRAISENPEDEARRLILSDALEENGHPHLADAYRRTTYQGQVPWYGDTGGSLHTEFYGEHQHVPGAGVQVEIYNGHAAQSPTGKDFARIILGEKTHHPESRENEDFSQYETDDMEHVRNLLSELRPVALAGMGSQKAYGDVLQATHSTALEPRTRGIFRMQRGEPIRLTQPNEQPIKSKLAAIYRRKRAERLASAPIEDHVTKITDLVKRTPGITRDAVLRSYGIPASKLNEVINHMTGKGDLLLHEPIREGGGNYPTQLFLQGQPLPQQELPPKMAAIVAHHNAGVTNLNEISRRTGFPLATVHYLKNKAVERGLIEPVEYPKRFPAKGHRQGEPIQLAIDPNLISGVAQSPHGDIAPWHALADHLAEEGYEHLGRAMVQGRFMPDSENPHAVLRHQNSHPGSLQPSASGFSHYTDVAAPTWSMSGVRPSLWHTIYYDPGTRSALLRLHTDTNPSTGETNIGNWHLTDHNLIHDVVHDLKQSTLGKPGTDAGDLRQYDHVLDAINADREFDQLAARKLSKREQIKQAIRLKREPVQMALNPDLIRHVAESDPDDIGLWHVFSDHLEEEGMPATAHVIRHGRKLPSERWHTESPTPSLPYTETMHGTSWVHDDNQVGLYTHLQYYPQHHAGQLTLDVQNLDGTYDLEHGKQTHYWISDPQMLHAVASELEQHHLAKAAASPPKHVGESSFDLENAEKYAAIRRHLEQSGRVQMAREGGSVRFARPVPARGVWDMSPDELADARTQYGNKYLGLGVEYHGQPSRRKDLRPADYRGKEGGDPDIAGDDNWTAVRSSWILGIKRLKHSNEVAFMVKNGQVYSYPNAPVGLFPKWLRSQSPGKFFWHAIRGILSPAVKHSLRETMKEVVRLQRGI